MKAILFENRTVEIDRASTQVGGSWQGSDASGTPISWETAPVKFFYERAKKLEEPFIIDVGANTGTFCLLPALSRKIRGVAFEPVPHICTLLKQNLALNKIEENVAVFNVAVADKVGSTKLKFPKSGRDSGLACIGNPLRFNEWVEIDVPTTTLDAFAAEQGIKRVDLLKIDTEGCELFVLQGGRQIIQRDFPGILLEYHAPNTRQFGYEPEKIAELLFSWGYDEVIRVSKEDLYFRRSSWLRNSTGGTSGSIETKPIKAGSVAGAVTIFTTPKPFKGHTRIIQRNAIKSWLKLKPRPEIILIGDDEGVAETASEFSLLHLPQVAVNSHGTPLVDSIFEKAQSVAANDLMAYVNTDIILFQDFYTSIGVSAGASQQFLMIGRRYDLDVWDELDLDGKHAERELRERAASEGLLHQPTGIDYFAFRRGLYRSIPPFALGRTVWDNWLIFSAKQRGAALVDASRMVFALHQEHDYRHAKGGVVDVWKGEEASVNRQLARGRLLTIDAADYALEAGKILPAREATPLPMPTSDDYRRLKLHEASVALSRGLTEQCADLLDYLEHLVEGRTPGLKLLRAKLALKRGAVKEASAALREELAVVPESEEAKRMLRMVEVALQKEG